MQNPYLPQQANAITNQVTSNLQNRILPGLNMGASANNNFGSNRHMIAQGQAIGDTNQGLSNSLANLYGNAYAQDQQLNAQQSMQQAALANQLEIAKMNDATQRMGLGNQYSLGLGNLGLGFQNSNNQFNLGQQAQNTNAFQAQTQRDLGFGNLGLGYTQAGNQFTLGQQQNQNQAQSIANQYALGQQGNQLQRDLAGNQLDFNYWNAGNNFGLQNKSMDQGFYTAQRGQDLQQMGLGANLVNQGNLGLSNAGQGMFNLGQQQQQQSWFPYQQFGGQLAQFGGFGGSTSQNTPGPNSFQTGLGGALTAAQLWKLLTQQGGN